MSRPSAHPGSVARGKVLAVIAGFTLCIEHKFSPFAIFTYSIIATRAFYGEEDDGELITRDIRRMMLGNGKKSFLGIFHAYRSATRAAHHVTQYAKHISSQMIWRTVFPDWLAVVTNLDTP